MQTYFLNFLFCAFLLSSCNQDEDQLQYPKTFIFHHSNFGNEKAFVFGENESYFEINSNSGNLKEFSALVASDIYGYIRNLAHGNYIESFDLLSKDSLRIKIWEDGIINSYTLQVNINNENIEISDTSFYISNINWDKTNHEIKFSMVMSLGILGRNGIFYSELGYNYCEQKDLDKEFKNILVADDYKQNDTLGLYLLDLIYKE